MQNIKDVKLSPARHNDRTAATFKFVRAFDHILLPSEFNNMIHV